MSMVSRSEGDFPSSQGEQGLAASSLQTELENSPRCAEQRLGGVRVHRVTRSPPNKGRKRKAINYPNEGEVSEARSGRERTVACALCPWQIETKSRPQHPPWGRHPGRRSPTALRHKEGNRLGASLWKGTVPSP